MWQVQTSRRGLILFVVVAMLALFAVVAVAFYYYAGQEQLLTHVAMENQNRTRPDPDALMVYALRTLIFDEQGYGPFRTHLASHSLLRNMFGSQGLEPFTGTGRLHGKDYSYDPNNWYDHYYAACYIGRSYDPAQDGSCNPPYTYPDMNHVFLGHLTYDQQTGQFVVEVQSFIRRSVPGFNQQSSFDPYDPANLGFWVNPNWSPAPPGSPNPPPPLPPRLRQALVFRPHPLLHQGFPPPQDAGGDVRNLPPGIPVKLPNGQLHYGNDSIWMDLGFPVQIGPDGRAYKPLFAFFITDLDGRCNLNALALWNPAQVLLDPAPANARLAEAEYLLRHADTNGDSFTSLLFPPLQNTMRDIRRRHMLTVASSDIRFAGFVPQIYREPWNDSSQQTDSKNVIWYGHGNPPSGNPDDGPRWGAPNPQPPPPWQPYPMQYGVPTGTTEGPGNNPRVLWAWQGSTPQPPGLNRQLIQSTYVNQGDFELRPFQQGTSWHGVWTGRIARTVNRYGYDPQGNVILIGTAPFPSLERFNLTAAVASLPAYPLAVDLANDPPNGPAKQQLRDAILRRQKLAREIYFRLLYVCGLLDENPAPITTPASAVSWLAQVYPTKYNPSATDIPPYWPPTGVRARVVNPLNPTDEELKPLRYLAQLAVNIVDYLDQDLVIDPTTGQIVKDPNTGKPLVKAYSTPFMFYTDMDGFPLDDPARLASNSNPPNNSNAPNPNLRYWVFGTERPRVVINEVLFEYQEPYDDKQMQRVNGPFEVRCWIELFNADPAGAAEILGPDDPNDKKAKLTDSRYKLVIAAARNWANLIDPIAGAANGDNVLGEVAAADLRTQTTGSDLLQPPPMGQTQPTPPWQLPANGSRYLLIGPTGDTVDNTLSDPANRPPNWIRTDNMKFTLERKLDPNTKTFYWQWPKDPNNRETGQYLVLLRRLAYPQMNQLNTPERVDPNQDYHPDSNPYFVNPYITVDMMLVKQGQGLCDRTNNGGQSISWARTNPYADALNSLYNAQDPNPLQVNMKPTNTWHSLGKPNAGLVNEPPYHPDAANLPSMDLLLVSAYKAHLLTRRYKNPNYPEYHYAPWFDESARIYRVLEFLEMTPPIAPVAISPYRVRGKVNLNTANAQEIFAAITEWPNSSGQNFTQKWDWWFNSRQSRPNFGFASGNIAAGGPMPNGLNAEDSWWRRAPSIGIRILLDDTQNQPLQEHAQLFRNIYDRLTTRSNVFAVWCTVGFFEADPNTGQLGRELDADKGQQVRYRFFAIVDRTILAEWMLLNGVPVENMLGRTDIDPRKQGPKGEPPCVIYWSRIQ